MTDHDAVLTAIIEDHALFRDTMASVVASMPRLRLGAVAADLAQAVADHADQAPGLVILDYSLEDVDAPDLIDTIRTHWPAARCLVLSGHLDAEFASRSLDAGASAYVLKGKPDDFVAAVDAVLDGGTYVSAAVSSG